MLDASTVTATTAILAWYITNIFTVVLNKYLFQIMEFKFPLTLTALHMLISTFGSFAALKIFRVVPLISVPKDRVFKTIIPLGIVFCVNIILGNISLRWIPVSFMQTVKSSVPAFTVVLQTFLLGQYSSKLTYMSLIPVVGGVALASFTEVNFQMIGFLAALVSSLTTATQSVVSAMLLGGTLKLDSLNLLYYMAPVSFIFILPFALYAEYTPVMEYDVAAHGGNEVYFYLFISGLVAYLLNICVFFAIKSTSALTMTVFGNLKVVAVIGISVMIFKNEVTWWNGLGCFVATVGIIWYNAIEYQIKEEKKRQAARTQKEDEMSLLKSVSVNVGEEGDHPHPHPHPHAHTHKRMNSVDMGHVNIAPEGVSEEKDDV